MSGGKSNTVSIGGGATAAAGNVLRGAKRRGTRSRLGCLDCARGLAGVIMIFVDQLGSKWPSTIDHAPWNGLHLADIVMPGAQRSAAQREG